MMSANGVASDPREAAIGADQFNTGEPNGNDQNQEGIRSGDLWTNPDAR
jgi:hypothetical protein